MKKTITYLLLFLAAPALSSCISVAGPSGTSSSANPEPGTSQGVASIPRADACSINVEKYPELKSSVGATITLNCPASCSTSTVYGTDTYTTDSSICSA